MSNIGAAAFATPALTAAYGLILAVLKALVYTSAADQPTVPRVRTLNGNGGTTSFPGRIPVIYLWRSAGGRYSEM
jgi:hypothetical protein